jgi:ABC-2 type transport system permease protein
MRPFMALLVKEVRVFFTTPLIYIIIGFFSLLTGIIFFIYINSENTLGSHDFLNLVIRTISGNIGSFFIILSPLLTMHLIANEHRNNTLWLLQFSKLTNAKIVWAKFLAVFLAAACIILTTGIYPIILLTAGYYDIGLILSNYLGILLLTALYLSIGIMASAMAKTSLLALLSSLFLIALAMIIPSWGSSINNTILSTIFIYSSPTAHFTGFNNGIISSYSICYYLSGIVFFNYLAQKILEARHL